MPAIIHTGAPIKAMLRAMYLAAGLGDDVTRRRLDGDLKRAPCPLLGGKSPTRAMQTLGTEWGRDLICPELWVEIWRFKARHALAADRMVINDSVRFENEATAIRDLGGTVIALTGRRGDLAGDHASESGVAADLVVENTGTPDETALAICGR